MRYVRRMHDSGVSRRKLLKTIALGLVSALGDPKGHPWFTSLSLAQTSNDTGSLILKLGSIPALQSAGGSVLIQVPSLPVTVPQVLVTRKTASQFFAVKPVCTHAGCTVNPYNPSLGIVCFCHFSRFDADGTILNGPAASPLMRYTTTFDGADTVSNELLSPRICKRHLEVGSASSMQPAADKAAPIASVHEYRSRVTASLREGYESVT